jgi:ParB-like chromosome segregation protein Spo0J
MADGFHREAAAERLGRSKVEAEIRQGTRDEALECAVRANVSHGKALSSKEYREAVRRLRRLHPDWGYGRIAGILNRGKDFVRGVVEADDVRRGVVRTTPLSDSHLREIARAPRETWEPLVKAAETKGWTRDETREVVRTVTDESVPSERKEELLKGKAEPIVSKGEEPAFLRETVERRIAEGIARDKVVALTGAWSSLSKLEQFNPKEVVNSLDNFHLERVVKDIPRDIDYLTQLVKFARQRLELWEEVDKWIS